MLIMIILLSLLLSQPLRSAHHHFSASLHSLTSATVVQVAQQRLAWQKHHRSWKETHPAAALSEQEFFWALDCVKSRAFSGPWSGGTLEPQSCLPASSERPSD